MVTSCSPRPMRAVQRARLCAITWIASQAALAAKRQGCGIGVPWASRRIPAWADSHNDYYANHNGYLMPHAMTREHPLHLQGGYEVHRVGQGSPREEGLFRKDVELAPAMIPVQRVASEQDPVIYVVQDMSLGISGRRN